ncbi:helix-turn-helix transcriptional regulator [Pararhizobium sp. PWRC1-1]|uniref:helix-turn-helix transcriptional regulator n=1 Tax=Pararhizobium sp. PWRC1-1 TaxID=2804566 RepID=UPI003CF4DEB6
MYLIRGELVGQLHAYRLKAGLTQGDIAWKLGFSLPTVSRWERGICNAGPARHRGHRRFPAAR